MAALADGRQRVAGEPAQQVSWLAGALAPPPGPPPTMVNMVAVRGQPLGCVLLRVTARMADVEMASTASSCCEAEKGAARRKD